MQTSMSTHCFLSLTLTAPTPPFLILNQGNDSWDKVMMLTKVAGRASLVKGHIMKFMNDLTKVAVFHLSFTIALLSHISASFI